MTAAAAVAAAAAAVVVFVTVHHHGLPDEARRRALLRLLRLLRLPLKASVGTHRLLLVHPFKWEEPPRTEGGQARRARADRRQNTETASFPNLL